MAARVLKGIRFQRRRNDSSGSQKEDEAVSKGKKLLNEDIHKAVEECLCTFEGCQEKSSVKILGMLTVVAAIAEHENYKNLTKYEVWRIFNCVSVNLSHGSRVVRTSSLRLARNLIKSEECATAAVESYLTVFLTRYVDLSVSNSTERGHALRLIRRILHFSPTVFPLSISAALAALSAEGCSFTEGKNQRKDQLWRVALAVLQELALLSPEVYLACGGVRSSLMAISELNEPRTLEAVLLSLLSLYDLPQFRHRMHFSMESLCAPFTEFYYSPPVIQPEKDKGPAATWRDRSKPSSLQAILSAIRTWTGLLGFCSIGPDGGFSGGHFHSLTEALKIPNLDTRKKLLDLLDQLFRVDTTFWTDEVAVALDARNRAKDSWKLKNGFVAQEGKEILPSLSRSRPDLVKNHTALLIYSLVQANLPDALVQVISTSDSVVSVRATVLLGEFFYLAYHYLPPVCYSTSICLSNLMDNLTETAPDHLVHLQRAIRTSMALGEYQSAKFQPLKSASSYLRQIIYFASAMGDAKAKNPWRLKGRNTARLKGVIKFSRVCLHEDHLAWDWTLVCAALRWPSASFRNLEDSYYKLFIRNLVNFFKPSKNRFSLYEYGTEKCRSATSTGCFLVDFLLSCSEGDSDRFAAELLEDIRTELKKLLSAESAHDCLFSPAKMISSACRDYFLIAGRFSQTERGLALLDTTGIFQDMLQLVSTSPHEIYMKLVLSTLNFGHDGFPRSIFKRVVSDGREHSRYYATLLLGTHLRVWHHCCQDGSRRRSTLPSWAIGHLIVRLSDDSYRVKKVAEEILDEICDDSEYLTVVMEFHSVLSCDEAKFSPLLARFLSNATGFRFLQQSGFLRSELERWLSSQNQRYVAKVELSLCECLSQHQKDGSGAYGRVSDAAHLVKDLPVPCHIYGELGRHADGVDFLRKHGHILRLVEALELPNNESDPISSAKASLWALGNLAGASPEGLKLVQSYGDILAQMCRVASSSPVLSLRGTAFYALNMIARTIEGAEALKKYGWIAVRHDHLERWPVVSEDEWTLKAAVDSDLNESGISVSERNRTTSQCSDKSVSFADEIDFFESLEVHEEESSDGVRWDLESTSSISKEDSIDRKKVRFFPGRKKANTLPRITPTTPVSHRRSQSLSESQAPIRFFQAVRDSFRSRKSSFTKREDSSGASTPDSSSFGFQTLRNTFRRFSRLRNSDASILATSPPTANVSTQSAQSPDSQTTDPGIVSGQTSTAMPTPLAQRLKKKRSAFFANLEVVEPLSVSMPGSSAMREYEKQLASDGSDSEADSEPEISKDGVLSKFMASSPMGDLLAVRKQSIIEYPKKGKHEHLSRVGSTLCQLKTVQYKTRQLVIEQSTSSFFMGLCLPSLPELIFPSAEFLNPKDPNLSLIIGDNEDAAGDVVENHLPEFCLRCRRKQESEADDDKEEIEEDRINVRRELLSLVAKTGTGIGLNAHEEGLLRLKQAYPSSFQDLCLYSDVCHYISTRTYHLRSRRFLQELFIDFAVEV